MNLSNESFGQLHSALADAFNRDDLMVLVRTTFDGVTWEEIVPDGKTVEADIRSLIRWAEKRDSVDELLQAARAKNPRNGALKAVTLDYVESKPVEDAGSSKPVENTGSSKLAEGEPAAGVRALLQKVTWLPIAGLLAFLGSLAVALVRDRAQWALATAAVLGIAGFAFVFVWASQKKPDGRLVGIGVTILVVAFGVAWLAPPSDTSDELVPFAGDQGSGAATTTVAVLEEVIVAVPDVVGLRMSEAMAAFEERDLAVGTVDSAVSDDHAPGTVIRTDPEAGAQLMSGEAVNVLVARRQTTTTTVGPTMVAVPELSGLTRPEAIAALAEVGLQAGSIARIVTDGIPPDTIIESDPGAGEELAEASAVAMVATASPTPIEAYLSALLRMRGADRIGETSDVAATLRLVADEAASHSDDLREPFAMAYVHDETGFVPAAYAAGDLAVSGSDLRADAEALRGGLDAVATVPAEYADFHEQLVEAIGRIADNATVIEESISAEVKSDFPVTERLKRRFALKEVIVFSEIAAHQVQYLCLAEGHRHTGCDSVVDDGEGPDAMVALYLEFLDRVAERVEWVEERATELAGDWDAAADVLGDRADYLTAIGNEGWWRLLGYGDSNPSEEQALRSLLDTVIPPEAGEYSVGFDEIRGMVLDFADAIEEMTNSFLHLTPRARDEALSGLDEQVVRTLEALATACAMAGDGYVVCQAG